MSCGIPPEIDLSKLLIKRLTKGIKIVDGKPATDEPEDYIYLEEDEHVWFNTDTQEVRIAKEEDLP